MGNEINIIKEMCNGGKIIWKEHAAKRMKQRNIKTADIENSILTGEIIETYAADYPCESYLILGLATNQKPLHVVCSVYQNMLCIITAYFPNNDEWESDNKTRKVEI